MAKQELVHLIALVFISMLANSPRGGALTCMEIETELLPCLSYVTGGGSLSPSCCDGLKELVASIKTRADRQAACKCMNSLVSRASDADLARAAAIPGLCGVPIPFNITRNADCSKVPMFNFLVTSV